MNVYVRTSMAVAAIAGGSILVACSETAPSAPVASVTLTAASDTIRAGTTFQLTVTARDAAGNVLTGRTFSYTVTGTPVAVSVDANGLVTGTGNGTNSITATAEGVSSGSVDVTSWIGVTGSWSGQVTILGGTTCPLLQAITEDATGTITGTMWINTPCGADALSAASGGNNAGGVADSLSVMWTGNVFNFTTVGNFDGTDVMTGEITGGNSGCIDPGDCVFTQTRGSIIPQNLRAPEPAGESRAAGGGILGR